MLILVGGVAQVLPGRTHPVMQMSGASGYILQGIRVDRKVTPTIFSHLCISPTGRLCSLSNWLLLPGASGYILQGIRVDRKVTL